MYRRLALALILTATPALADNHNTPTPMRVSCNANGAVITLQDNTTYYLGNKCDALRKGGGTGKWWYAAAAFLIEIDGKMVRFANDLGCPKLPYCTYAN